MAPTRMAKALVAAVASAIAALAIASGGDPAPSSRLGPLAGAWRLREGGNQTGPAVGIAAPRSLHIDVDGPLVSLIEPGGERLTLWVDGPPVETGAGPAGGTRVVSRSAGGLLIESAGGGAAARETLRVEPGDDGRLVRTITPAGPEPREATRLVYERERDVPAGGSFPALHVASAMLALLLVALVERGRALPDGRATIAASDFADVSGSPSPCGRGRARRGRPRKALASAACDPPRSPCSSP